MTYKQIAVALIAIVAFMFIIGLAGRADYYEYVYSNMPQDTYNRISKKIGTKDGNAVAKYYIDHEKEIRSEGNTN